MTCIGHSLLGGDFMGLFGRHKEKNNELNEIVIECMGSGQLTFKKSHDIFICKDNKFVFKKYCPTLRISNYLYENMELYKDIFAYINLNSEAIEKNLKELYLTDYLEDDVEEGFKITDIDLITYDHLVQQLEDMCSDEEEAEKLKSFIDNLDNSDICLEIDAARYENNQLTEEYAIAYINCRTKCICYCYEKF